MPQQGVPLRVLQIEDSEDDAFLVLAVLRRAGYDVQAQRVTTPGELQAALNSASWDLVLADYSLPGFDAPAALAILQQSGLDIPFIIVSGTIDEVQAVTALRAGARDFVTKGQLARLVPAIDRELRDAENRRQRREVQAQIRQQEASFRLLFESNPLPMWVYASDSLAFLEVNRSAVAHYGFSRDEFLGMTLANIRPLEDLPALLANVQAERSDFRPREKHWRHRLKDGQLIDVEITSHALTFNGRAAVLVVAHDVTDRNRAEAAVAYSERRFRALIENSADAITLVNPEGLTVYDSPNAARMLGYEPEDLLGRNAFQRMHPDDVAIGQQALRQTIEQPMAPVTGQLRLLHRDGRWRWVEYIVTNLIAEPAVRAVVVNYRDVTERKEAEVALQQAEAQFRTLVEQIPAITYRAALNDTSSTLYISPQIAKLGYTPEEHLTDPTLWAKTIHPDDRERARAGFSQPPHNGKTLHLEYRILDRQGGVTWVTDDAVVVHDAAGQPLFLQGVVVDITERKLSEARNQRQLEQLAALRAIDLAITSSLDMRLTLDVFLTQVIGQLGVDAASILLFDASDHSLAYAAGRGFRSSNFQQARLRLGEGRAGRAALERRIIAETGLGAAQPPSKRTGLLGRDNFVSYYGVPLIAKGQVLGVLEIFHRTPLAPDAEWLEFLEALAGQAAIAIENATLFTGLQRTHQELAQAYDATIEGWSRALDLRDKETEGHSQRVTEFTLRLARGMEMGEAALMHVRRGALLHDMGKIGIPDQILLKPGPLTADEWVIMRQHPTLAYELLSPIAFLRPALDIPYCHHEKWDGSGYPRGLLGEQIPLSARLFAVVDVWDALSSNRPYRPAWPAEKVLEHIRSLSGTHFDPQAVQQFLAIAG